jgi:hypothetical protein
VALPHAYELDDAPGFERFFLVTCARAFSVQPVLDAAHAVARGATARTAPLALPSELEQSSVTLEKATP